MAWQRFEDIMAWQDARQIARDVYAVSGQGAWAKDFGLRDQIRRSAVSIMSNIAEGFARGSQAEFRRFLEFSRASAAEVQSLLYVAADVGYLMPDERLLLHRRLDVAIGKIAGLMNAISARLGEDSLDYDAFLPAPRSPLPAP